MCYTQVYSPGVVEIMPTIKKSSKLAEVSLDGVLLEKMRIEY